MKTFVNNTRLIRKKSQFGYSYTWRFEDEFGQTLELGMEDFSAYISERLSKLRVKTQDLF
jgi:hypothetical protein